jgi:hypothetical protein
VGALVNFLGGAAFRAVWSGVSNYFDKRQEHKYEIQRTVLQGRLDAEAHARNMAAQRMQAEMGVKTIQVQAEAAVGEIEADAWRQAVASATKPIGIKWVDAWNSSIRPALATLVISLWGWYEFSHMAANGWVISVWSLDMMSSIIGFWYASREIGNRTK